MSRDEIETNWPLVVKHRVAVVRFMEEAGSAASMRLRKASRRAVIDGYNELHDIPCLASQFGMSASGVNAILARAVRVARRAERGELRPQKRRSSCTLTVTALPAALIRDVDEWALLRRLSRREAATELIKIGLDATAKRHVETSRARISQR